MKYKSLAILFLSTSISLVSMAQTSQTAVVEDFKTTPTTQQEKKFPQVS